MEDLFHPAKIETFRRITTVQRNHAGRITVATLIYAYAYEPIDPETARAVRSSVRGWGAVANFIGDETALDYLSDSRFELFRKNITRYGEAIHQFQDRSISPTALGQILGQLFDDFFD